MWFSFFYYFLNQQYNIPKDREKYKKYLSENEKKKLK